MRGFKPFPSWPEDERAERKRLYDGLTRYIRVQGKKQAVRAKLQHVPLDELREMDPDDALALISKRAKKNPYSTGYVAAKIRAHTARRNALENPNRQTYAALRMAERELKRRG